MKWFIAHWTIPAVVFSFPSIARVCTIGVSLNVADSGRFFFVCDVVNVPSKMLTGERPTELYAFSLNLGTTVEGDKCAAGEEQDEGVFHGGVR